MNEQAVTPGLASSLGAIRAITLTAPDLDMVEQAWTRDMGYVVRHRCTVSSETASSWNAPAVAGNQVLILGPESGEPTILRFVQQNEFGAYIPEPCGWTTTEITVADSDALYVRLKDSAFEVTGAPATVPTYEYLRAMQAVGPAGERLNLTCITETRPDLAVARSFVGRCFIAVQSTPDIRKALAWFERTFGNKVSPIRQLPSVKLAVVTLSDGTKIEVDEHPGAQLRPLPPGGLPQGLAIVSFECSNVPSLLSKAIGAPALADMLPLRGARTITIRGLAGELLELIET